MYVGFLAIFSVGLAVAGVAAGRLIGVAEGQPKPLGMELVGAWATDAAIPFIAGLVLMLIGGVGARRVSSSSARDSASTNEDPSLILGEIKRLLSVIDAQSPKAAALLSDILEEKIPSIFDQRDALMARYGVGAYAEFAGDFASFERNAARAWSALTDGVVHEAEQSLLTADAALERATASYERLAA